MADIKLTQVKNTGGSLEIGDIIQTERTSTIDGKVFLPLDNTLLDAGTYPQLAATYGNKYKLRYTKPFADNATTMQNSAFAFSTDDTTLFSPIGDNVAISEAGNDILNRTLAALAFSGVGYNPYDISASKDGQYIQVLLNRASTLTTHVIYSTDFGSTFTLKSIAASNGTTPVSSCNQTFRIKCNADGSLIRVALIKGTAIYGFYESVDGGANWAEIWAGLTVQTGLDGYRGEWSDDLSTFAVHRTHPTVAGFVIRNGVHTVIPAGTPKSWNESNTAYTSVSGDGTRIVLSYIEPVNIYDHTIPYSYTDDDGTTWTTKGIQLFEVFQGQISTDSNYSSVRFEISAFAVSRVNKDYVYFIATGRLNSTTFNPLLMRLHLPTGNLNMVTSIGHNSSESTGFTCNISCQLHSNGTTEMVNLSQAQDIAQVVVIDYGQYLVNPDNVPNLKIVADAP